MGTQERPYKCLDCDMTFLDPSNLKRHKDRKGHTKGSQHSSEERDNLKEQETDSPDDFISEIPCEIQIKEEVEPLDDCFHDVTVDKKIKEEEESSDEIKTRNTITLSI